MLGAFVFRGLATALAAYLIDVAWVKLVGAAYLLYLPYGHFFGRQHGDGKSAFKPARPWLGLSAFWARYSLPQHGSQRRTGLAHPARPTPSSLASLAGDTPTRQQSGDRPGFQLVHPAAPQRHYLSLWPGVAASGPSDARRRSW